MKFKSGDRHLVIGRYGIRIEYYRTKVGGGTYVRDLQEWRYPWLPASTKRERRAYEKDSAQADALMRKLGIRYNG